MADGPEEIAREAAVDRTVATRLWERWRARTHHLRQRRRHLRRRVALVLAVIGPGVITSNVNNEAGGIYTYSLAGAKFGYAVLWALIPMCIALYVTEEMCARMCTVTGKGLSDLIREEFGFRVTFFVMLAVLVVNFGNVLAEFAGVASSLRWRYAPFSTWRSRRSSRASSRTRTSTSRTPSPSASR